MATSTYSKQEVTVGLFVIVGIVGLAYLSLSVGDLRLWPLPSYTLTARFAAIGELKRKAPVRLAGVKVGEVESIRLEAYRAEVKLSVQRSVKLPTDTIASIRTEGLLGESYISLSPGASSKDLQDGGRIAQTEPALDLLQLLIKYGLKTKGEDKGGKAVPPEF